MNTVAALCAKPDNVKRLCVVLVVAVNVLVRSADRAWVFLQSLIANRIVHCVSSCQKRQMETLLLSWRHIGPGDYGEFDPMDMLAKNRGWHPLTVGEQMSVGLGGKRYKIIREE